VARCWSGDGCWSLGENSLASGCAAPSRIFSEFSTTVAQVPRQSGETAKLGRNVAVQSPRSDSFCEWTPLAAAKTQNTKSRAEYLQGLCEPPPKTDCAGGQNQPRWHRAHNSRHRRRPSISISTALPPAGRRSQAASSCRRARTCHRQRRRHCGPAIQSGETISPNAVEILDVLSNNRQSIPLTQG